jgi:SAM-dependent methyltransferase
MFSPPDYAAPETFLKPRRGPWSMFLYLHRQPILEAVNAARPVLRGTLLDVGCGNKPYAKILECHDHIGVDLISSLHSGGKIDVFYDGNTLPFGNSSVDSILCTEVLEHCINPQSLLQEMARVLKSGGFALVTAPMAFHHHEEPSDYYRFTRYGMEHLARQSGLSVVWITPRGGFWATTVATFYAAIGYTISRRPFIDVLLWIVWPITLLMLQVESFRKRPVVMSLGWQMCVRK